ncbi:hypothetical protein ACIRP0_22230 [Streptomyces sp. NPDC101733]|uniref:hypothetical protein n=1 Tax=unclassified Streptomyces TaxID=2593676 RepID=UPI00382352AF
MVPHDLRPEALRVELIRLGQAFRDYQERTEPDLALLARLHARKARAFTLWADITGDGPLRQEAQRAEDAARTTRAMHANRAGRTTGEATREDTATTERLLARGHAVHTRSVLDYVQAHTPRPEAEVRLAVLLLTLRAARDGTGNITGHDLAHWLSTDAEQVLRQLVAADWLHLPGSVTDALTSRPENFTAFTVPTLLPEQPRPFNFGKTTRTTISGWVQKAATDRKVRQEKPGAALRLLTVYTAAHTRLDGRLGHTQGDGIPLDQAAAFCALSPEAVGEHADMLVNADWLAEAQVTQGRLHGRLAQRVLPTGGLL